MEALLELHHRVRVVIRTISATASISVRCEHVCRCNHGNMQWKHFTQDCEEERQERQVMDDTATKGGCMQISTKTPKKIVAEKSKCLTSYFIHQYSIIANEYFHQPHQHTLKHTPLPFSPCLQPLVSRVTCICVCHRLALFSWSFFFFLISPRAF